MADKKTGNSTLEENLRKMDPKDRKRLGKVSVLVLAGTLAAAVLAFVLFSCKQNVAAPTVPDVSVNWSTEVEKTVWEFAGSGGPGTLPGFENVKDLQILNGLDSSYSVKCSYDGGTADEWQLDFTGDSSATLSNITYSYMAHFSNQSAQKYDSTDWMLRVYSESENSYIDFSYTAE